MKRSKSISSRVLRKLGLLAAMGTAAVGQLADTSAWAQSATTQTEASATEPSRNSSWGGATVAKPASANLVSPYLPSVTKADAPQSTANSPIDLGSAYRPQGKAAASGANQAASVGETTPAPQKPTQSLPAAIPAAKAPVDLTTAFLPKTVDQQAKPTADEAESKPAESKPVETAAVEEKSVPVRASIDDHSKTTADAKATDDAKEPSLLSAMLAGDACAKTDKPVTDVNRAHKVKNRFDMLGIAGDAVCFEGKTEKKDNCPSGTCDKAVTLVKIPQVYGPPTVQDAAVSQASHVVPAQWKEAQPRAIQIAQVPGVGSPFGDDPTGPANTVGDHFEVIEEQDSALEVRVRRSLLLRTPFDIYRTAVVDSAVCDVVQFTPREVSIVGKSAGSTNVTFWFEDGNHRPVTYVVRVIPDLEEKSRVEVQYRMLEDVLSELFPDSKVRLILVADKLIVKGQAASAEEAANIMSIVRGQSGANIGNNRNFLSPVQGFATPVFNEDETGRGAQSRIQVVNMLQVPGIQQVALRVKIAQLNRSAARGFGIDGDALINLGDDDENTLFVQSMLNMAAGNAPALITQFDEANINIGLRYLQQQGVIRLLSEPTLVTLSGRPATFVSGGEFAVPTIVGSSGLNAVTTDFRAFGVIVSFMPTVLNKDRIRLQVAPEFSSINEGLTNGGTFGLNTNAVTTTVEMREGQTLAIAGLLEDTMKNTRVGNIPYLERIFGTRDSSRNENELIILVTPELVHPMEPEEVPPLPGFDVTEPTNKEFYWGGHLEGHPTSGYRSTVWPELRRRYKAGGPTMTSGQFGHGQ